MQRTLGFVGEEKMNEIQRKFLVYLALTPIRSVKNQLVNLPKGMAKPIKPNTLLMAASVFFVAMVVRRGEWMIVVSLILLVLAWGWKTWVVGDFRVKPPL